MKKIIGLILTLALMLSICAFPVSAASTATSAQIEVLTDLGIVKGYEDGSFKPDAVITRAEVVAIINRVQGLSDAAKAAAGVSIYSDVKATDWFAGDVNLATQMGVISGDGDGTFRPNDQVKYEEAVKMIVAALGYNREYVMKQGGWPTGYLVIAAQTEVSKGLSVTAGEPAYRGVVAKLVYQALTAPMMVLSTYDDDGKATYKPDASKTLLNTKLNISKVTGWVSANNVTSLTGSTTDEVNKVRIHVEETIVGSVDTKSEFVVDANYELGCVYNFYVAEDDDDEQYIISAEEGKNESVIIEIVEDELIAENGDNKIITLDADNEEEEYILEKDYTSLVNGKVSALPDAYSPTDVIELVDVDNNGKYDIVFVTNYIIGVVDNIYGGNTKIGLKNTSSIDMKPYLEKDGYSYSITIDGTKRVYDISDLMEFDVLTIVKSDKHIDIAVSRDSVSGEVKAIDHNDGTYTINGEDYKVSNAVAAPIPTLGLEGTFYLDTFGRIAWYKGFTSYSGNLGYIAAMGEYTSLGETYYEVQILTKSGNLKVYTLSTKVNVNSIAVGDVITYRLKDDKISSVEVLIPERANLSNLEYDATVDAFDGKYGVDESTIVFFVGEENIDDYTVGNVNSFVDERIYDISIIETDEYTNNATIVVVNSIVGGIAEDAPLAVLVNKKIVSIDNDVVNALTFLTEGKEVTINTDIDFVDDVIDELNRGDVFVYSTNEDGNIDKIALVAAYETAEIVVDKAGNVITLEQAGRKNIGNVENIYLVDLDKSKVVPTIGAIGDIVKSQPYVDDVSVKAYIYYVDEKPFEVVVYFETNK